MGPIQGMAHLGFFGMGGKMKRIQQGIARSRDIKDCFSPGIKSSSAVLANEAPMIM
jgi:hypothetical protein